MNVYVRIRREKEKRYEMDIVDKRKKELKLFYRYVNENIEQKV